MCPFPSSARNTTGGKIQISAPPMSVGSPHILTFAHQCPFLLGTVERDTCSRSQVSLPPAPATSLRYSQSDKNPKGGIAHSSLGTMSSPSERVHSVLLTSLQNPKNLVFSGGKFLLSTTLMTLSTPRTPRSVINIRDQFVHFLNDRLKNFLRRTRNRTSVNNKVPCQRWSWRNIRDNPDTCVIAVTSQEDFAPPSLSSQGEFGHQHHLDLLMRASWDKSSGSSCTIQGSAARYPAEYSLSCSSWIFFVTSTLPQQMPMMSKMASRTFARPTSSGCGGCAGGTLGTMLAILAACAFAGSPVAFRVLSSLDHLPLDPSVALASTQKILTKMIAEHLEHT